MISHSTTKLAKPGENKYRAVHKHIFYDRHVLLNSLIAIIVTQTVQGKIQYRKLTLFTILMKIQNEMDLTD